MDMAQNPYADIFGRLIEYSFQRKMWEEKERRARERALEERRLAANVLRAKEAEEVAGKLGAVDTARLVELPGKVPGVSLEEDPQRAEEIATLRGELAAAADRLKGGQDVPELPGLMTKAQELTTPSFKKEGEKASLTYGSVKILLPDDSDEATQAAIRVKTALAEAEDELKLKADQARVEAEIQRLFKGLPETDEAKRELVGMVHEFEKVVGEYKADPVAKASAVQQMAFEQMAALDNSPNSVDRVFEEYKAFLERAYRTSKAVLDRVGATQSAAAVKQKFEEEAWLAMQEIGQVMTPVLKELPPVQVNKAELLQKVNEVFYMSDEGKKLREKYKGAASAGLQKWLQSVGLISIPTMVFPQPER